MTTFLFKIDGRLRILPSKIMDEFNETQALSIALACMEEQRTQLVKDAVEGDKYFYGRRVVEALEVTLMKLEEKFPHLREQVKLLAHPQSSN